ncbi:MAG: hypothetical protein BGO11_10640 [Solirubrobacterales bacterium 70-9]|nr:MAG: hypothetical protein BGO11_10640 [Solirubrobacterales bacterium 70-9]
MARAVRPQKLKDQVETYMRDAINSGEWSAGELHSVGEVADEFGVSRTPVREAVLQLADAGLVAFERNVGFRILRSTPSQIVEIFHLRLLLEVPATRLTARDAGEETLATMRAELAEMSAAAKKGDESLFMQHDRYFHDAAISGAGNDRLITTVDRLRDATRLIGASTVERRRSLFDIADEHRPILDAFERRDAAAAAAAMRDHVVHTGSLLLSISLGDQDGPESDSTAALKQRWSELSEPDH